MTSVGGSVAIQSHNLHTNAHIVVLLLLRLWLTTVFAHPPQTMQRVCITDTDDDRKRPFYAGAAASKCRL